MAYRWRIVGWIAPVVLCLILVGTSVRLAANSLDLYEILFDRNEVSVRSGIQPGDLLMVGRQVRDYLTSDYEPLQVIAPVYGKEQTLFSPEEAAHMADVKALLRLVTTTHLAALSLLAMFTGLAIYQLRRLAFAEFARWTNRAVLWLVSVLLGVSLVSVVAFERVFLLFHQIAFPQGNYTFDPRFYFLTRLFPTGFWSDISIAIGALCLLQALVLLAVGFVFRRIASSG